MMQQRERLYQLDKPILARDAAGMAAPGPDIPPGWTRLDQCNLSAIQGEALVVPHVLLHPEIGVALIDIAPAETAGAEPAFRDRLESARFAAIFPGQLPVVHLQLQPEELESLGTLLPQAFATLPPLRLPGGDGWVSVVRRALASRGPLRDRPPVEQAQDRAMPPMLNREVAAQRAGLAPAAAMLPPEPQPTRRPSVPVVLALSGVAAVTAAMLAFWSGSQPASPPERSSATLAERSGAPSQERSGTSAAAPAAVVAGGAAPILAPSLVPAAPPTSVRGPDAGPVPAARERLATTAPRPAEPAIPAPPVRALPPSANSAALPPPPASLAPERGARLTVRAAANIRTQPNNKATIIRTAPQGEVLREFSRSADDWVEVGDTRPQGWMFGKYLVPVKP